MLTALPRHVLTAAATAAIVACGGPDDAPGPLASLEDPFASRAATLLDFEFDGEVVASSASGSVQAIRQQMLYTVGQLNGLSSVGRLGKLSLSRITRVSAGSGRVRIRYHAKLPVSWNRAHPVPERYELVLPRRVDSAWTQGFFDRVSSGGCFDEWAHGPDLGNIWYYYRPNREGCTLLDTDVLRISAAARTSPKNTTGKYPEYHRIWSDKKLKMVAIFGKYEAGATAADDAGIAAYDEFIRTLRAELPRAEVTPSPLPAGPGVSAPEVRFVAALPGGRSVDVTLLLVDDLRSEPPSFDRRYEQLTPDADLIFYNGHAGLGANVRALSRKGRFVAGKYQIFFMNGCDTFAYIDEALVDTRARLNRNDPTGTRFMDVVTNGMPSYFHSNSEANISFLRALIDVREPRTYESIFDGVDSAQVVNVTGEEDNVFEPGLDGIGPAVFQPLEGQGVVAQDEERRFSTPLVRAGTYTFELAGDGDADLYVRVGEAPTLDEFDCRPYLETSSESCTITLDRPGEIHVMISGYAERSSFRLTSGPS